MPLCKKCKLWHYRDKDICSFCEGVAKEEKELALERKCLRCEKKVKKYYRKKLCFSCFSEIKKNRAIEEELNRTNNLLGLVKRDR